jgi:hypothetical protein
MRNFRDAILILVGAGLLFTLVTGINLSDLQVATPQPADAPMPELAKGQADTGGDPQVVSDDPADADASPIATPTPTPTPAVTIMPTGIVIYGKLDGPCDTSVTYESFTIIVAEALGKDIDPELIHPPVHPAPNQRLYDFSFCPKGTTGPKTQASLEITPECEGKAFYYSSSSSNDASKKCYQVIVDDQANLRPGEYKSTLYISPKDGIPATPVDVSVKVRLNIWWPIITVALGVLVAEFLVAWRKRKRYSIGWANLRAQWLDLLSEKTGWITQPMKEPEQPAKREALRQAKTRLRDERKKLNDWIAQGRKGQVKIGQVPDNLDAAKDKVYPLRRAVEDNVAYLKSDDSKPTVYSDFQDQLEALQTAFKELGKVVASQAKEHLVQAVGEVNALYVELGNITGNTNYTTLKKEWDGTLPPSDEKLRAAWNVIKESVTKKKEALGKDFTTSIRLHIEALPPNPPTAMLASHVDALTVHLSSFRKEIVDTAVAQQTAIKDVVAQPGQKVKTHTESVLKLLADLETPRSAAAQKVISAEQPLKYHGNIVGGKITALETTLAEIDEKIDDLTAAHLSNHAILGLMLKPIRESLARAEKDMSKPQAETDMVQIWQRLQFDYGQGKRLVKVGERLVDHHLHWADHDKDVKMHTERGYQYLLSGELLRAEIELERAEQKIASKLWLQRLARWKQRGKEWWSKSAAKRSLSAFFDAKKSAEDTIGGKLLDLSPLILVAFVLWWLWSRSQAQPGGRPDGTELLASFPNTDESGGSVIPFIVIIIVSLWIIRLVRRWWLFTVLREVFENVFVWLGNAILVILSQILTIVVAVALILVAQELSGSADTWGSPFDFVTAFTWGVFANRVAEPIESTLAKVEALQKKPAEGTEGESAEESSKDT